MKLPLSLLMILGLTPPHRAQSAVEIVLREGDPVGLAQVQSFSKLFVTDAGQWLAQTVTETQNGGQLDLSAVVLGPSGALPVQAEGNWDVGDSGRILHVLHQGTTTGLYADDTLIARVGAPVDAPGLLATAKWTSFYGFRLDDQEDALVFGLVADFAQAYLAAAVVRIDLDETGEVLGRELVLESGDMLPTDPPENFGFFHLSAFTSYAVSTPDTFAWTAVTTNGECLLIGLDRVAATTFIGFTDPADPVLHGRRLDSFDNRLDVNAFGSFVYSGTLTQDPDTADVVILDGDKFVQEGDVLPALGAPLGDNAGGPLFLTNSGDVFWLATLRGAPPESDAAYMRNHEVLIREGTTTIDGQLVTALRGGPDAFHASDDGRFWVGAVELDGVQEAVVLADFGLVVPFPGRGGNDGTLEHVGGNAVVGGDLTLRFDQGQAPGVQTLLAFSEHTARPNASFGVNTVYGEVLIGSPRFVIPGPLWNGLPVDLIGTIPNVPQLLDTSWYGQGLFVNGGVDTQAPPVRLTNGLRFEIGAP